MQEMLWETKRDNMGIIFFFLGGILLFIVGSIIGYFCAVIDKKHLLDVIKQKHDLFEQQKENYNKNLENHNKDLEKSFKKCDKYSKIMFENLNLDRRKGGICPVCFNYTTVTRVGDSFIDHRCTMCDFFVSFHLERLSEYGGTKFYHVLEDSHVSEEKLIAVYKKILLDEKEATLVLHKKSKK